jgi:hypothetical protein
MTRELTRERSGTDEAERVRLPIVCRLLRTKMSFGALEGVRDWRFGESTTAVYWCLRTMESSGPDDGFAHPHRCREGRACFRDPSPAAV